MFLLRDAVAFVGIDDELRFDAEGFQRVPELERLRRGAFAVALADEDSVGVFTFLMNVIGALRA